MFGRRRFYSKTELFGRHGVRCVVHFNWGMSPQQSVIKKTDVRLCRRPIRQGNCRTVPAGAAKFTGQNARVLVECVDCRKPRVVHSTTRLSERQKLGLAIVFSEYEYSCGSEVVPPEHSLHNKVFVRTTLTCESRVESSYYSSDIGRKDTCCFCACPEAEVDGDLKKQYKTVLPVCVACRAVTRCPA